MFRKWQLKCVWLQIEAGEGVETAINQLKDEKVELWKKTYIT